MKRLNQNDEKLITLDAKCHRNCQVSDTLTNHHIKTKKSFYFFHSTKQITHSQNHSQVKPKS
jgi:hypothetical protein